MVKIRKRKICSKGDFMDQILINGLRVMARHGYTKEEKIMEQEFEMDIILHCSLEQAIETDKIEHTVECGELGKLSIETLKEEACQLIEKAAQKLIENIFDYSSIINTVELTLKKTQSGILADFDSVGVRLIRVREPK